MGVEDTGTVFTWLAAAVVPGTGAVVLVAATVVFAAAGVGGFTGVEAAGLGGTGFPLIAASIRFDTCSTPSRTEFNLSTLSEIFSYPGVMGELANTQVRFVTGKDMLSW